MNEIKTPKSFESLLKINALEPIKTYIGLGNCYRHGEYETEITEYEDGDKFYGKCPKCTEEEREKERQKEQERLSLDNIRKCKEGNIDSDYWNVTFNDFIPKTRAQQASKDAVMEMIRTGKGKIVIIGSNGAGKTLLGSLAVKAMGGKIYEMHEIAAMIRQSYTGNGKSELEIEKDLINLPLLVIDEIGRLKISEAVLDWFSYILNKRHANGKPFILLGNLHFRNDCEENGCQRCFENCFDKDILSRLKQDATIIEIITDDERRLKKTVTFITDRRRQ